MRSIVWPWWPPAWLRAQALPDWAKRYERRLDDYRLPKGQAERQRTAETVGADGFYLLEAIYAPTTPAWVREVPAVQTLRRVWVQQFYHEEAVIHWRTDAQGFPPSALMISSPYDLDAHYAKKDTTSWIGYKVHVTETCDDDGPHLITQVEISSGPIADGTMTPAIHAALERKDLLPRLHIVDTGYLDAELLVTSRRDYDVDLLGPTRKDYRWQARTAAGFGAADFTVDFARRQATCPQGHTSVEWSECTDVRGNERIYIRFSKADCGPCQCRPLCTKSQAQDPRRSLSARPWPQYAALHQRRTLEGSDSYRQEYARRVGVEGTISQGVRVLDLRWAKYVGEAKTHLQHILTAAAINFVRVSQWLDAVPLAQTRRSSFTKLMTPAA